MIFCCLNVTLSSVICHHLSNLCNSIYNSRTFILYSVSLRPYFSITRRSDSVSMTHKIVRALIPLVRHSHVRPTLCAAFCILIISGTFSKTTESWTKVIRFHRTLSQRDSSENDTFPMWKKVIELILLTVNHLRNVNTKWLSTFFIAHIPKWHKLTQIPVY